MVLFYFITGLSVESAIVAFATYLSRPREKDLRNDDKSRYEIKSWRTVFYATWSIAILLISFDIVLSIKLFYV